MNSCSKESLDSACTQITVVSLKADPAVGIPPGTNHLSRSVSKDLDQKEQKREGTKRFFGIIFTLAAALQFSLSALIVKILNIHPLNLGTWRWAVMASSLTVYLLYVTAVKKENVFKTVWPFSKTTCLLILQAILCVNSIILVLFGIKYLNISDMTVISTSAPVFVSFFAFLFLGERCGVIPVATTVIALVGVGIISKPPLLSGAETLSNNTIYGVASSFSSMLLLSIVYVIIRYLREVNHAVVNITFAVWGCLQCGTMAYLTGVLEVPTGYTQIGLIITTALLGFSSQSCLILALKYEQAGPVALVRTTEVVFAFLWQILFLGVNPDYLSIIGAVVTLSGVILITLRKMVMVLPDDHISKKKFGFLLW